MSTHRISLEIKVNIHVLSKSTGIIISVCACIAKTLQYCIGLQKNIFDPANIEIMQIILGLSWIFFEISFQYTWWPLVPYFWSWVTKKMYLPTFSESNVWDFRLVVTGISEIIPQFFKDFRMLPKMSKDVLTTSSTSEAFERDSFSLLSNSYDTKSILSAFLEYFCGNCFNWISLLIMYWRTITNSSRFVGQAWEIVLWWCVGTMS